MATRTALSSYEMYWYPWDDTRPVSYTHLDVYKRQALQGFFLFFE